MNYCTQNQGNCAICSLVNYGRDCHNNPLKTTTDDWRRYEAEAETMMTRDEANEINRAAFAIKDKGPCDNCGAKYAACKCGDYVGTDPVFPVRVIAAAAGICPRTSAEKLAAKIAAEQFWGGK